MNFTLHHRHTLDAVPKAIAPAGNTNGDKPMTIATFNNHVWFYAGVDSDRGLDLIQRVHDLDAMLRNERLTRDLPADHPATPIWLHIQSGGGDLFAGFAIANQIHEMCQKTPIYSVIEGLCASAATLISMSCTRRFILPDAMMLIHQLSAFAYGTHEEFKDEMALQDELMTKLIRFYTTYSKITEAELREMLKRNTWVNSARALELGMVDEAKP